MTKRIATWVWLGMVLALLLAGCARGGRDLPDVQVDLAVDPTPPRIGPASIMVTLRDGNGQPITGATMELEGNMNHAGMVPVLAQASEVAAGRYQANLEFTMAGDWFILVRADLSDGRSMERRVDLVGLDAVCGDTPVP
jgi:hypothetical protein